MPEHSRILAERLAFLTEGKRKVRRARALAADRTLQVLAADLVAARTALSTIEKYAFAVGALVDIRVRTRK